MGDLLAHHIKMIKAALDNNDVIYEQLVHNCVQKFKDNPLYQNDIRFLKIWMIYIDFSKDYRDVSQELHELKICGNKSLLYEAYALFLEGNGEMREADRSYQLGISRNANPAKRLKKAHTYFLERICLILDAPSSQNMEEGESNSNCVNPWSISVIKQILQKMNGQISKYQGYHASSKCYTGTVALSSLEKSSRNKVIEMGGYTYQITGCAGKGGFAQVYKARASNNKDEVVALKIQKPPFPWEFYMYRQLDLRIPENKRLCFGYAHRLHLYSDYSIIVTNFLAHKTLLDAINSNGVTYGSMDEVLSMYYTIEMLSMLEALHSNDIIHGDFKPDNLLIRQARDDLPEGGFRTRSGPWRQQGLCLIDWGRAIDLEQFPKTKFNGDCRTSGFRCIQMQENRPWTYQVDTYGLCGIVHVMLHNSWMEIEKKTSFDGGYSFQPKLPFKRYQKVELWRKLFLDLLNNDIHEKDEHLKMLGNLRSSFQDYMCSAPHLIKQLKQSLVKQKTTLGSS